MAVISIANAKGGSGKTTAAVLLATEFVQRGARTALLDCDDLKLAAGWARADRGERDDSSDPGEGTARSTSQHGHGPIVCPARAGRQSSTRRPAATRWN